MSSETGMDAPITRRELKEELTALEERLETRLEQKLEQKLAWVKAEFARMDARFEDVLAEFRRHTSALLERTQDYINVLDDKYKALPGRVERLDDTVHSLAERVQRLEDAVPKPKRPRRAAR